MSKLTQIYKGLIVTTYEIEPKLADDEKRSYEDKITFKESSRNGEKAVFLKNIMIDENGTFHAEFVPDQRAARYLELFKGLVSINKDASPLFCVHGFNVQPSYILNVMREQWYRFVEAGFKYHPVPVIWPCNTSGSYNTDQDKPSQGAGKHLKTLVDAIDNELFPRKSLLMHSMGNHVVFNGACGFKNEEMKVIDCPPDVQFENIFMVAADLPHDIFWKEPWEYDNAWIKKKRRKRLYGQKTAKATNFFQMLKTTIGPDGKKKPIGKIYVVHNPRDTALHASSWGTNYETRLGSLGHAKDGEDKIRDDIKPYVVSKNIYPLLEWIGDDWKFWHSYQFEKKIIEYYFSKDLGKQES